MPEMPPLTCHPTRPQRFSVFQIPFGNAMSKAKLTLGSLPLQLGLQIHNWLCTKSDRFWMGLKLGYLEQGRVFQRQTTFSGRSWKGPFRPSSDQHPLVSYLCFMQDTSVTDSWEGLTTPSYSDGPEALGCLFSLIILLRPKEVRPPRLRSNSGLRAGPQPE